MPRFFRAPSAVEFEAEKAGVENRLSGLREEIEEMRLGELSADGKRRLTAFERQLEREKAAEAAQRAGNVLVYLDYVKTQERAGASRYVVDITRTREWKALVSEKELIEKLDLMEHSRNASRRLLTAVRRSYPPTPKNAAGLKKKSFVAINTPAFGALVARARIRAALLNSLRRT